MFTSPEVLNRVPVGALAGSLGVTHTGGATCVAEVTVVHLSSSTVYNQFMERSILLSTHGCDARKCQTQPGCMASGYLSPISNLVLLDASST